MNRIISGRVLLDNNFYFDYSQIMVAVEYPNEFNDIYGLQADGSPIRGKIEKQLTPSIMRMMKNVVKGAPSASLVRCGGDVTKILGVRKDGLLMFEDPSVIRWVTYNAYWGRTNKFDPIFHVQCRLGNYDDGGYGFALLIEDVLAEGAECPLFIEAFHAPADGGRIFDAVPTDPLELAGLERSTCICFGYSGAG